MEALSSWRWSPIASNYSGAVVVRNKEKAHPTNYLVRRRVKTQALLLISDTQVAAAAAITSVDEAKVSWEIWVGAAAGVVPFVVAGIEFTKRIIAQRRCGTCKGSGLVLRDNKYYFRCPRCGGFLPWQSWKRFFQVK